MTPSWRKRARCRVRVAGEQGVSNGSRSARRRPAMLKAGRCKAASRVCSGWLKKLRPLRVRPLTGRGWVVERSDAGGEVVETGEVFEVAAVAPEQDVREGGEAVDVLFDGSKGVACWALLMFYLAVVLEGGGVVGG